MTEAEGTIIALETWDIRFPTSRELDGSDAMNPDPDYSAAYAVLRTDAPAGSPAGHAFVFTTGRGNDIQAAAIRALAPYVVGRSVDEICDDLGGFYRENPLFRPAMEQMPIAQPWYAFPGTNGVRVTEAIVDQLARIVEQRATPEAVLADMAREVRRLLPR